MFQESLVESAGRLKSHRGATTAISVSIQSLLIAFMVVAPLFYTEALPSLGNIVNVPLAPTPAAPPRVRQTTQSTVVHSEIFRGELLTPTHVPQQIAMITDEVPPPIASLGFGVPHGVPGAGSNEVLRSILGNTPAPARPNVAPQRRFRISGGVSQGLLVHEVKPRYPPLALSTRVQGAVVLQAVIARDGTISNLRLYSGHPLLARAALDAVSQWRYRPYLLNGEPVEVETQITVTFTLSGR